MKILVTGGAGFIGSHLCERLSKDFEVFSLDNYSTGSEMNHVKGVTYIHDHTKYIDTLKIVPDIIFHLGEYSRVEQSFDDFDTVYKSNIIGTKAVLDFARKYNCKLIYAGSSTKFGDIGSNSSPYAWSKAANTQLVKNYGDWFGINYAITYFYNVYGPREISDGKYSTLIAKFAKMYKKGLPLTVTAPGTQKRNFTHVEDTVDALMLIAQSGYGDNYGIGSPESFSVLEVAQMFTDNIIMTPEKKGNRLTAEVVSDKIIGAGWKPKHHLKDYIESIK